MQEGAAWQDLLLNLALKLAHRGYVMETGTISFSGTGKDLLSDDRVRKAYLGEI